MEEIIGAASGNTENHYVALLSNGAQAQRRPRLPKRVNTRLVIFIALMVLLATIGIFFTLSFNFVIDHDQKPGGQPLWEPGVLPDGLFSKYSEEFESFIHRFGKTYESVAEKTHRFEIFIQNMIYIELHNDQDLPYQLAPNGFSDLTFEEFKAKHFTGYKPTQRILGSDPPSIDWTLGDNATALPTSINWKAKGCVTPVKNQGQCGSCWSFSVTGAIEGAYCAKHGILFDLSEQQLVDCSNQSGCDGGSMESTYSWLKKTSGLCTEASYPYNAHEGICHRCLPVVRIQGFSSVPPRNAAALQAALTFSPVSVAIEADQKAFQFYSSGVFTSKCGTNLDHGVLAVGYGTDQKTKRDYWMVKNSWGPQWGVSGYILLDRSISSSGQCGILLDGSYPSVL